jgi:ferric-dicitrate binding protein FerR (iron transport regulator)
VCYGLYSTEELKAKQEKERQKREKEEQERLRKAKEEHERLRREESEKKAREELETPESGGRSSQKRFLAVILAVILVPGAMLLGYWAFAPSSTDAPITQTVSQTPRPTTVQGESFTNTIGMECSCGYPRASLIWARRLMTRMVIVTKDQSIL